MKRIEIIVSPTGESQIETHGFIGESCRRATRKLEQALGAKQAETTKPEYFAKETTNCQQQEQE